MFICGKNNIISLLGEGRGREGSGVEGEGGEGRGGEGEGRGGERGGEGRGRGGEGRVLEGRGGEGRKGKGKGWEEERRRGSVLEMSTYANAKVQQLQYIAAHLNFCASPIMVSIFGFWSMMMANSWSRYVLCLAKSLSMALRAASISERLALARLPVL